MTFFYLLLSILIFGFLIFIHELGHFLTAKLFKVKVNEFSINMGPKLFGWRRGETAYSFRLLPIGGYCAMEGEDGENEDPRSFVQAKWWKRLIILCAGSAMNFLTGFVVVLLLFVFNGTTPQKMEITAFDPGSALSEQGLQLGDELYSIDGKRIYFQDDLTYLEGRYDPTDAELVVVRDGEKVVYPHFRMEKREFTSSDGTVMLRYGFSMFSFHDSGLLIHARYAGYQCVDFVRMVWWGLSDLITGRAGLDQVGGVVKIVDTMVDSGTQAQTVSYGIQNVLYLGALIAVNLAVMNMLPIPALDGGRVLFLLINTVYTAITKKKINPKYEAWIHGGAMILLLLLMAFLVFKDVRDIIS